MICKPIDISDLVSHEPSGLIEIIIDQPGADALAEGFLRDDIEILFGRKQIYPTGISDTGPALKPAFAVTRQA